MLLLVLFLFHSYQLPVCCRTQNFAPFFSALPCRVLHWLYIFSEILRRLPAIFFKKIDDRRPDGHAVADTNLSNICFSLCLKKSVFPINKKAPVLYRQGRIISRYHLFSLAVSHVLPVFIQNQKSVTRLFFQRNEKLFCFPWLPPVLISLQVFLRIQTYRKTFPTQICLYACCLVHNFCLFFVAFFYVNKLFPRHAHFP